MIHDTLKATAITLLGLMVHSAVTPNSPTPTPPNVGVITPAGSDALASLPVDRTPTATTSEQEAVSTLAVASYNEVANLQAQLAERDATIAALEQQVARLTPKFTEPQKPVAKAQPVSYQNYQSCGPNGCGRRGLFGRRR